MYDLVIIGASAAGSAAAVYAARRRLNFIIISKDIGGEVVKNGEVENWLGIVQTTGIELAQQFKAHLDANEVTIENGWEVTGISQENTIHTIHAKKGSEEKNIQTKSIIIATGIHPKHLRVPGEAELQKRGVTSCTVCDGPLYRNKITTTIGAGNTALESALMLADIAQKAYLITKYPNTPETNHGFPKGENILIEKILKKDNVEIIYNANTTKILGDKKVEGVEYKDLVTGEMHTHQTNGAMVHIGMVPNSGFTDCVKKNENKEIEIDLRAQTSCKGIFAAGDVTNIPFKQLMIASGQGVIAALSAIDYLNYLNE